MGRNMAYRSLKYGAKLASASSRIGAVAALAFALTALCAFVSRAEDVVGVAKVGPTTNDVTTVEMPFAPMGESKFQNWQLRC